jgi:hypothetical protein
MGHQLRQWKFNFKEKIKIQQTICQKPFQQEW